MMDFSQAKDEAVKWTKNSNNPFELVGAIEEERRLIFEATCSSSKHLKNPQNADLHAPVSTVPGDRAVSTSLLDQTIVTRPCSFYVICPVCCKENSSDKADKEANNDGGDNAEGGETDNWHVWSDDADVLQKLSAVQDFLHMCRKKNLSEILDKVFISLKKLLSTSPGENHALSDEDDDDAGYQDDDDDPFDTSDCPDIGNDDDDAGEGMAILPARGGSDDVGSFSVGLASQMSVHRILKDLKQLKEDACKDYGIEGSPRGDNLFLWDVKLTNFPKDTMLGKDLEKYAKKYKREAVVFLEMKFPEDYPMAPPFVRVIKPKFQSLTGHITIGGSICMEMLTRSGWRPTNDIEGILVQIRAEIMSDPNTSLDPVRPDSEYSEVEARTAFNRMVQRYGWK